MTSGGGDKLSKRRLVTAHNAPTSREPRDSADDDSEESVPPPPASRGRLQVRPRRDSGRTEPREPGVPVFVLDVVLAEISSFGPGDRAVRAVKNAYWIQVARGSSRESAH